MPVNNAAMTAEKKVKGRKRHIVTDTLGCLLAVVVHAANIHDTKAGGQAVDRATDKYPTIVGICGDEGYRGSFEEYIGWQYDDVTVDISKRIKPEFEVLPKRWIVERTFAWFGNYRRLSKDFEVSVHSAENMVIIANLHILLKRIC